MKLARSKRCQIAIFTRIGFSKLRPLWNSILLFHPKRYLFGIIDQLFVCFKIFTIIKLFLPQYTRISNVLYLLQLHEYFRLIYYRQKSEY